jgi:hypothetical protein
MVRYVRTYVHVERVSYGIATGSQLVNADELIWANSSSRKSRSSRRFSVNTALPSTNIDRYSHIVPSEGVVLLPRYPALVPGRMEEEHPFWTVIEEVDVWKGSH